MEFPGRKVSVFFEPEYYRFQDERLTAHGSLDVIVLHNSGSVLRLGARCHA
jgi:hypothetical protein